MDEYNNRVGKRLQGEKGIWDIENLCAAAAANGTLIVLTR